MADSYIEKARRWATTADSAVDYAAIRDQIEYFAENLFGEFTPAKAPDQKHFLDRLTDWLNNTDNEDDQRILFRLVTQLLFVGSKEFETLYRGAFNGPIARWLIDQIDLRLDRADAQKRLRTAEGGTWFCAITDSMQIAEFYHLNHIEGVDVRPVWHTLQQLHGDGSVQVIDDYVRSQGFERIVLLEDFVGSGNQMAAAVEFVSSLPSRPPILLCPIIICPAGVERANQLAARYDHLTFEAVLALPAEMFISRDPSPDEDAFFTELRPTLIRLHPLLRRPKCKYPPFGFRSTGSLVVMHTNCPNNTLPVVHHASDDDDPWSSLFRRCERR